MRRIGSDAVQIGFSKFITLSLAMVATMLLARFRTLEEFGTYSQLLLVSSLLSTVFMLGLPGSVNYFLGRAESAAERQKFLSVYYTLSTLLSLMCGLVLVLSVPLFVTYFDNPWLISFTYVLATQPWTSLLISGLEGVLVVYQRVVTLVVFRVLNSSFLVAIVIIVEVAGWGFGAYMALYVAVQVLFATAVYFIVGRVARRLRPGWDNGLVLRLLKFSVPLGLAGSVGILTIEMDRILIGMWFTTEQMAVYFIASREMPVAIVTTSLTAVLLPRLARVLHIGEKNDGLRLWASSTVLSFGLIGFLASGFFVFAPEVITLLYSDKYLEGVGVFRIYCLTLLWRATYFGLMLNAIGRTKGIFLASLCALCANLPLSVLFYQLFGDPYPRAEDYPRTNAGAMPRGNA